MTQATRIVLDIIFQSLFLTRKNGIEDADSLSSEFPTAEEIMRNHENKAVSTRWACVVEKPV